MANKSGCYLLTNFTKTLEESLNNALHKKFLQFS